MGPLRLSQIRIPFRSSTVWMAAGGGASGFLLWNATGYLLISGTDKILISL